MKSIIKSILSRLKRLYFKVYCTGNNVQGISVLRRLNNFSINGVGNTIIVKSKLPKDVRIVIYGNNHRLNIEKGVLIKKGLLWFEDHDCEISIGYGTTIEDAELSVAENGTKINIGTDCMFSKGVHICTTDSHSIISVLSGQRTNYAKDIEIKNHVWLGYNTIINKGVTIEENSVIAGNSVVTKSIPSNVIAAGVPARVVKTGIIWERERVYS